jgi:hypothetical protein
MTQVSISADAKRILFLSQNPACIAAQLAGTVAATPLRGAAMRGRQAD